MSDQEIDEEEEKRTTPLGLFNYAESYWTAANALETVNMRGTHHHAPVSFLYYHAIELYLKAFLRFHKHTVAELANRKFGHSTRRLKNRAEKLGLVFNDKDKEILRMMAKTDIVIRSRYLQTGYRTVPETPELNGLCSRLRDSVGRALKSGGHPVRL